MRQIVFSEIGSIHLILSILALIFGTLVLVLEKGTKRHKQIGYAYFVNMLGVIVTAFMIYRLFGRFGIFHIMAIVSTMTILAGMIPAILRKPAKYWFRWHFGFMYWSVMGLYAAFVAETMVRVPQTPFFGMVGIATFLVMLAGAVVFVKFQKKWSNIY